MPVSIGERQGIAEASVDRQAQRHRVSTPTATCRIAIGAGCHEHRNDEYADYGISFLQLLLCYLLCYLLKFRKCSNSLQGRPLWPSATYIINYYIHQVVTLLVADGHKGRPCKASVTCETYVYYVTMSLCYYVFYQETVSLYPLW